MAKGTSSAMQPKTRNRSNMKRKSFRRLWTMCLIGIHESCTSDGKSDVCDLFNSAYNATIAFQDEISFAPIHNLLQRVHDPSAEAGYVQL